VELKWVVAKAAAIGRKKEAEEEVNKGAVFQRVERAPKGDQACNPNAAVSFRSGIVNLVTLMSCTALARKSQNFTILHLQVKNIDEGVNPAFPAFIRLQFNSI
jgi:hypothetical protein